MYFFLHLKYYTSEYLEYEYTNAATRIVHIKYLWILYLSALDYLSGRALFKHEMHFEVIVALLVLVLHILLQMPVWLIKWKFVGDIATVLFLENIYHTRDSER